MKQKRNRILILLVAALVIGLLVWRLWPRTLESVSGLDFDQVTSVSARTETSQYIDGTDVFTRYHLDGKQLSPSGIEQSNDLLTGFEAIQCRPTFSNLLRPWLIDSFTWVGPVDFLYGFVSCGDSHIRFTLTDRGELTVGNRLYHITNKRYFDVLWNHITTYGTKEENIYSPNNTDWS